MCECVEKKLHHELADHDSFLFSGGPSSSSSVHTLLFPLSFFGRGHGTVFFGWGQKWKTRPNLRRSLLEVVGIVVKRSF